MTIYRLVPVLFALAALPGCATDAAAPRHAGSPSSNLPATPPAAGLTPQNEAALYLNVIDGLAKQQRYGAALAFLDDFSARRTALPARYWLLRGDALLGMGRRTEAAGAYARLEGTTLAAQGWNGRGRVAAAEREWNPASANFRKAVAGDPSNADFLNNLAFAGLQTGADAAAAGYLRQAHELAPGSELIRNNLIIALTLTGDQNGADTILKSIRDGGRREHVRAMVKAAIENSNFGKGKKS